MLAEFLTSVQAWDTAVLGWVQTHTSGPAMDWLMALVSDERMFLPLFVLLAAVLVYRGGWRGLFIVAGAVALVTLTDQLSASLLRPWIGRERPDGTGPSMPSSHATNTFAQAVYFGRLYPRLSAALLGTAAMVGFSRVYLNKHYPTDVLCGAVLGGVCGWGGYIVLRHLWQRRTLAALNPGHRRK